MNDEYPQPESEVPGHPVGSGHRSLNPGEQFFLWASLLLPGLVSPFAMIAWFLVGYAAPSYHQVWLVFIPVVWLALLLGSCYLCGWLHAIKRSPTNRKRRALRTGGLFLLGQLIITPTIGLGTCMVVTHANWL